MNNDKDHRCRTKGDNIEETGIILKNNDNGQRRRIKKAGAELGAGGLYCWQLFATWPTQPIIKCSWL